MNYHYFDDDPTKHSIALLTAKYDESSLLKYYLDYLPSLESVIVVEVSTQPKRTSKAHLVPHWEHYEEELAKLGIKTLLVTDPDYFKHITGLKKTEAYLGERITTANGLHVFFVPNYQAIFYNPEGTIAKIKLAMDSVVNHVKGSYEANGTNIVKNATYLFGTEDNYQQDLKNMLDGLHKYPELTCDIETYSLKFYQAGIGSIGFAWDKHSGVAAYIGNDKEALETLAEFFDNYKGKLIFHNAAFDVTVLIYVLYMDYLSDQKGMLKGLEVFKNVECTRIISYLATNSCAGNTLGLKAQSREFTGNYAEDVSDITKLPVADLLVYNLIDCLATWFVKEKNEPIMIKDNQKAVYDTFMTWHVDVIQMQLTGMPLNKGRVVEVAAIIQGDYNKSVSDILQNKYVVDMHNQAVGLWVIRRNNELKTKRVSAKDYTDKFNPNSSQQVAKLLFEVIGLPILEYTKAKEPATGKGVLKALLKQTEDPDVLQLLNSLIDYKDSSKILEAFIPHFLDAPYCYQSQSHFLYGFFTLGGTVSGRLSSNSVNLQQLPSGGKYGALIKSCFKPPEGWLFVGLDFNALEAKIDALVSKDPAKLGVYTDGYDSHAFAAYYYFPELFPDIVLGTEGNTGDLTLKEYNTQQINRIVVEYPKERGDSKPVSFALQYGGTEFTLMRNSGFSKEKATAVVNNYKKLYAVSMAYRQNRIDMAARDGHAIVAFGLMVRTPVLKRSILGTNTTTTAASEESRTLGNAITQSYCMLNNRAVSAVMTVVRNGKYKDKIRLCSQIHDASYYLIRNEPEVLKYLNDLIVEASYWQEFEELKHDVVKLGGDLDVFYPSWEVDHKIPNYATLSEIIELGKDIANA